MKFVVVALAVLGAAYLMMLYAGDMFKKVAFTWAPLGNVSYAACILSGACVLLLAKLTWK